MNTKKRVAWVAAASGIVCYYMISGGPKIATPHLMSKIINAPTIATKLEPPDSQPVVVVKKKKPVKQKTLRDFLRLMGDVESDNIHTAVNRFGMMGKYQFHPKTVQVLGFDVTRDEFLASPKLQDRVMLAYMRANRQELRHVISKFVGKTVRGVYITESGILAGAHLTGSRGVLAFFYPDRYSHKLKDANGTSISKYMRMFAGYSLRGL